MRKKISCITTGICWIKGVVGKGKALCECMGRQKDPPKTIHIVKERKKRGRLSLSTTTRVFSASV